MGYLGDVDEKKKFNKLLFDLAVIDKVSTLKKLKKLPSNND